MKLQLTLASRYLTGRKLRTFLTTLAIVIGVMVIFGTGIFLPSFMTAFQNSLLSASGQTDVMVTHKTGAAFAETTLRKLRDVDGIAALGGALERPINLPPNFYGRDATVSALSLVGVDPTVAPALHDYNITQGRFLERGDGNVAVISERLADEVGLKLGDTLKIPTPQGVAKLEIIGMAPGRTLIGNEQVLVTLDRAQRLLDMPGRINVIEGNLVTHDAAENAPIVGAIKAQLGDDFTFGGLSSGSEFAGAMQIGQVMFNMIGFLTLAMGGFIIFNTFRTVVAERRRDIGMLRAIGADRNTIVGLMLTEGLVQGVVGTAIGIGLGYLLGVGITAGVNPMMKQLMNIELTTRVQPALVVVSILLGVGVTLFSGLLPALKAGRVTPMEALRPPVSEVSQGVSRVGTVAGVVMIVAAIAALLTGTFALVALGGLLFLVGLVLVAPVLVRPIADLFGALLAVIFAREGTGELAQGNLTRQPSRSAITASATMIGLAIIVGMGGMMFSMVGAVSDMFNKSLGSDYLIIPPSIAVWKGDVGASSTLKTRMESIPGVGVVSSLRYAQSSLRSAAMRADAGDATISVLGIDPVDYPQIAQMDFQQGNPQEAFGALAADERNVIVNGILAAATGLKVGDIVPLASPSGTRDYRVVGVAGEVLSMKINTAYISQDNMRSDFNNSEDIFYQVDLAPDGDPALVQERLDRLMADYPQFRVVAGQEYTAEFMKQYDAIYLGFMVLLAVLAFPSLIAILNTLAIGVIERTREIGMLRAIGATRGQVRKTIVAEALLLAALGTVFGVVAGIYMSYVFVEGLSASGIFKVDFTFPLAGVIGAIVAGLVFGVLAAIVPARQASRMEIIQALRYE